MSIRRAVFVTLLAVAVGFPETAAAQHEKTIRVALEFRETGVGSHDELQGSGGVVILRRGDVRGRSGLGARSTETRTRRTTGIFTLVRDGGTAMLNVATRVPYRDVAFYRDVLTGSGYVTSGIAFDTVGTALRVGARLLDEDRVLVTLTPTISYFSPDGSGAVELTESSSEVVIRQNEPVTIGGATTTTNEVTRRILGVETATGTRDTTLVLTARVE